MNSEPAPLAPPDGALVVRPAQQRERARAWQFFPLTADGPPPTAQLLVALKQHPIERMVAALAWWIEDKSARFLVAHKPGMPAKQAAAVLVPALESLPGLRNLTLVQGRLLAEDEDIAKWLVEHGYQPRRTERIFESPCATVHERVGFLLSRHGEEIPPNWRTESIKSHTPDTVWPLIAPFRLISLESFRNYWAAPGELGYDPEFSNILFDGGTALGVLLVRVNPVCLTVDIRVVKPIPSRLRALANLAMFAHIQRVVTATTWHVLAFRGDDIEHRETANLARRMGGKQVAVRHIFARVNRPGGSVAFDAFDPVPSE